MSYSPTQIQQTQEQEDESPEAYPATQVQNDDENFYDEEDDQLQQEGVAQEDQDDDQQEEVAQQVEESTPLEFDNEEEEKPTKESKKKKKKSKPETKEKKRRQKKDNDGDYQQEDSEKSFDEEENNEEESDTKKKKRKRLQKGKDKKKRKKESSSETSPSNEDDSTLVHDEENEGPSRSSKQEDDEFNFVLKEVKARRSASSEKIEKTALLHAKELILRMDAAFADDAELYEKKKPALNKLQLLPEIVEASKKVYLQGQLISEGILQSLEKWIYVPGSNLPQPNINIQTGILTILNDLPVSSSFEGDEKCITKELLKSSKIPKTIKQIANNPSTTPNNRKLAKKIVERWSRLVYQLPSEYGEMYKKQTFTVDDSQTQTTSFSKTPQEPAQRKKVKSNSIRASIPKKESFDFTRLPASKPVLKKERAENEVHKRLLNVGTKKR